MYWRTSSDYEIQCNRHLNEVSMEISTWISILKRSCSQQEVHGVFPSFETMARNQLEKAAMSPFLLRNLFRNPEPSASVGPFKTREYRGAFWKVKLLPGGRYLLTFALPRLLQLWDLGFDWSTTPEWRELASLSLGSESSAQIPPSFKITQMCATGTFYVVVKFDS